MCLASVVSEEEHQLLCRITHGAETWIGLRRKSTSLAPPDAVAYPAAGLFRGADDWEWCDGTPFSFEIWNVLQPDNSGGGEDRVCMSQTKWFDYHSGKLMRGIYRRPRCLLPFKAIRVLATNRDLVSQCFAASETLRSHLLRMLYGVLSLHGVIGAETTGHKKAPIKTNADADRPPNNSYPPTQQVIAIQQVITRHLDTEWPNVAATLRVIRGAPPALSTNDQHRVAFLSHFVAASTILQAPAPNSWQALPASASDWAWPPGPLIPLRAASKLVQTLGPNSLQAVCRCCTLAKGPSLH